MVLARISPVVYAVLIFFSVGRVEGAELRSSTKSVTADGTKVDVTVTPSLTYEVRDGSVFVTGSSSLDLDDFQRKLPSIINAAGWPTQNCAKFGGDNLVVSPDSSALTVSDGKAQLDVSGHVATWGCARNPIPDTRVEWQNQRLGGVSTTVPKIVTTPGSPIKTKLSDDRFDWSSQLDLSKNAAIEMGHVEGKLDGTGLGSDNSVLGTVTNAIKKSLGQIFNADIIWNNVPEPVVKQRPLVKSIDWANQNGSVKAQVKWTAKLPASAEESLREAISHAGANK